MMNVDEHRKMRLTANEAQIREAELMDLLKKKEQYLAHEEDRQFKLLINDEEKRISNRNKERTKILLDHEQQQLEELNKLKDELSEIERNKVLNEFNDKLNNMRQQDSEMELKKEYELQDRLTELDHAKKVHSDLKNELYNQEVHMKEREIFQEEIRINEEKIINQERNRFESFREILKDESNKINNKIATPRTTEKIKD